jgi:peptidoglycan/xylan/chitin deacetylase (PgdA/CDA1 family)
MEFCSLPSTQLFLFGNCHGRLLILETADGGQDKYMKNFISRKETIKKIGHLSIIVGVLVFGLIVFNENVSFLANFKSYYTRSYIAEIKYAFRQNKTLLASAINAFPSNTFTVIPDNGTGVATSLPVLVYHGIVSDPDRFSLSPDKFQEHMVALKTAGYKTVTVEDVRDFIINKKTIPDKSILITFDDGRKDSYYGADPILRGLKFNAVMFIATGVSLNENLLDHPYYLVEKEISQMYKTNRWEIESHAVQNNGGFVPINSAGLEANFLSNKKWLTDEKRLETEKEYSARVAEELASSKNSIEKELGENVIAISYPFGDFGQQSINALDISKNVISSKISQNYLLAFQQVWPVDNGFSHNYTGDDQFHLKRIEPSPAWSGDELIRRLDFGRTKELAYNDTFDKNNGWKGSWGGFSINDDMLNVYATDTTSGSFSFLDGTYPWDNYVYSADINWMKGGYVSLVSRVKDNMNYTSCTFTDGRVSVEHFVNGENIKLGDSKNTFILDKSNINIGMAVNKNNVYCLLNGNLVLSVLDIKGLQKNGGIGVKTWDPLTNNTAVSVKKVRVLPVNTNFDEQILSLDKTELVSKQNEQKPPSQKPTPKPPTPPKETVKPVTPIVLSGLVPYNVTDFVDISAWKNLWGSLSGGTNGLMIGASATSSGGFSVLQGGNDWHNYELMVRPSKVAGLSFSLVARYDNTGKYASCTFTNTGRGNVRLDFVDGTKITQIGATMPLSKYATSDWSNLPFTMNVYGDVVTCTANNEDAIRATVPGIPATGGIGVKTWSKNINGSQVIIKEVQVTKLF